MMFAKFTLLAVLMAIATTDAKPMYGYGSAAYASAYPSPGAYRQVSSQCAYGYGGSACALAAAQQAQGLAQTQALAQAQAIAQAQQIQQSQQIQQAQQIAQAQSIFQG